MPVPQMDDRAGPATLRRTRRAVGVLAVILAVSATAWWRLRADPARLLAQAYTAARGFEWRLPDAGWARPAVKRGGTDRPGNLFEAQAIIARRNSSAGKDARWLGLEARADILDLRLEPAIALLQQAMAAAPNSPELLDDLAVAYALNAETVDRPAEFAAAVEFSTRALAADPRDRRALFNRALAFERLHIVDRAAEEWEQYLRMETDPDWSAEARARLQHLRALQEARRRALESDDSSDAVLESRAVVWLQRDRGRAREAAEGLLRNYGDRWLADAAREAVDSEPLVEAVESVIAGRAETILEASQKAVRLYTQLVAPAHLARARLEMANALNRSMRFQDCQTLSADVARTAAACSYHWIHIQALLQHSSCLSGVSNVGAAREEMRTAIRVAQQNRIAGLEFRAIGLDASQRTAAGDLWASWRENRDALERIEVSPYSSYRIHQSLANYSASAELWGWRAASYQFMKAAADTVHNQSRILEAANRTRTAALALEAHLNREYAEESRKAQELFGGLPESETRTRYLNSVRLLEGESYLRAGRPADATRILTPVAEAVVPQRDQWRAHQLLGLSQLRTGDRTGAIANLRRAAGILNERVASLSRVTERSQARREGLEAYRALAEALLEEDPGGASSLRVWLAAHGSDAAPDVVFLAVADGYVVWMQNGARMHRLARDRARVRASVSRLLSAARDPARPVSEIQTEGRFLLDALLPSDLRVVPASGVLTVLPDAEIAAVPFSLLAEPGGRWLAERVTVVLASRPRGAASWTPVSRALVVGAPATRERLAALPDSRVEAETVAARFPGSTLLLGSAVTGGGVIEALPRAELFHYSGHGYAGASVGGLYLADSLLTSASIKSLSLPACRLAVLAACVTAVGQTDGLTNPDSLVHALLDAGVHSAIATRWAVDSAATAALMARFYPELEATRDPARSLAGAAGALRAERKYQHPYFWAAFQTYE